MTINNHSRPESPVTRGFLPTDLEISIY